MTVNLVLHERRCNACNRWYATERTIEYRCGSCAQDVIERRDRDIARMAKSIAALRGALTRKAKR